MKQDLFFRRIKEELQKNNPDISNLLYTDDTTEEEQQFKDFLLNHLNKYINSHKYYQEIKKTFLDNIHQSQLYPENKHNTMFSQQPTDNQVRVYATKLVKMEKELRQYKQIVSNSELSLTNLRYFKFDVDQQKFDKKINRLVQVVNKYQQFLSNFSAQRLSSEQFERNKSQIFLFDQISEFVEDRFFEQMNKIQVYVMEYLQGMKVIQNYKIGLQQLHISIKSHLKQTIQLICQSAIKNKQEIQDVASNLNQMIRSLRQNKPMPVSKIQKDKPTLIQTLIRQLKKQINKLDNGRSGQPMMGLGIMSYIPNLVQISFLKQSINRIYSKLPGYFSNTLINNKLKAISQKIDQYNQTIEIFQKYTEPLNQLVLNCLFYFEIEYRSNILQPEYKFTEDELFILNETIKTRISQKLPKKQQNKSQQKTKIKNTQNIQNQFYQDNFEELSSQYQLTELHQQESIDYQKQYYKNINSLKDKQNQIKQWFKKYQQIRQELKTVKKQNLQLSKEIKRKMQSSEFHSTIDSNIKDNSQMKYNGESKPFPQQIMHRLEQMNSQNQHLKQQNQIYFAQKINLINQRDRYIQKYKRQLQDCYKQNQSQIELLKKEYTEQKQKAIQCIRIQHDKQKQMLKGKVNKLQQQYDDFKNKYYEQIQQRYNKSIMKIKKNKSKEFSQANFGTSINFSICNQDSRDELDQLIKLKDQNEKKYLQQITEKNLKIDELNDYLSKIKVEKESLAGLLTQKQKQIKQLQQNLKNQQKLKVQLQNKVKKNVQDLQKLQQTLRDLQASLQNERKKQDESRQMQQQCSGQISSNLPTLVHYSRYLFNADIFYDDQQSKKRLVNHIEWYARSRIKHTKLVYKFDQKNKINFHQYIDQVKGLALVIKTRCAILAGFYPGVLREKQILDKGGLIVSVTNNNSYCLHQRKKGDTKSIYRGMIYDTFFAIYGNAQIRIKSGFKTVFSNFGVSNSYYNNRGDKVDKLLNQGDKRETQFEYCQFYQVSFENQQPNYR